MAWINLDGKLLIADTAIAGVDSRGLRYGEGLFETILVKEGKVVFALEHLGRLWNGMAVIGLQLPIAVTRERLVEEILQLAHENALMQLARVRLMVFAGSGWPGDEAGTAHYTIEAMPLDPHQLEWNANGLVAGIYSQLAKSIDILANLKHNNYLLPVMAMRHAVAQGWQDAIVLNNAGRIAETAVANLFLVKNDAIITPPLAEGCIAGVLRLRLIQYLMENNIPLAERPVTREDLAAADEVFITNSLHPIRFLKSIDNYRYGSSIAAAIHAGFRATIS